MVRGVSKQVVVIKDTGSDMFEQAIFIVNPKVGARSLSDTDMAREARRIVSNCIRRYCSDKPGTEARQRDLRRLLLIGLPSLLGASALVASLILFL